MDFTHADAVDTVVLNHAPWQDRMGSRPEPPPNHSVLPGSPSEAA